MAEPNDKSDSKQRGYIPPELDLKSLLPLPERWKPSRGVPLEQQISKRILHLDRGSARKSKSRTKPLRSAGKLVVPKAEQRYALYEPLAELWASYAAGVGDTMNPRVLGDRVIRMDIQGARVEVVRSKDPGLVGRKGILIAETANTVLLVTEQDRVITVPKNVAVIRFMVGTTPVELMLPALAYRASERSARKMKQCKHSLMI